MIANEQRRSNSGSVVAWLLSEALVVDVVKKMAARKTCEICGTNYAKSAYYDHLPCQNKPHSDSG